MGQSQDESATRLDIKDNCLSAMKEGKQIKVDASMYSGVSNSAKKDPKNFNEGLRLLGAGMKSNKQKMGQSEVDSSIAGGRSTPRSGEFDKEPDSPGMLFDE